MIDAHVHLWRLGQNDCVWPTPVDAGIHRDFELPELLGMLDENGVERAVLVQSQESVRDTDWLLELADDSDRIAGVVGWADLRDGAAIPPMAKRTRLLGLRPMVQDQAADWYDDPVLDVGFAAMARHGLVLDALVRPPHLASVGRLATRFPDLSIVIDHAGKPTDHSSWRAVIAPLSGHANVHVKLSGLMNELPRGGVPDAVSTLLELFGAERLIWGSDWPVLTMAGSYSEWLALARDLVPVADRDAVFGDNAGRLYRIGQASYA